MFDIDSPKYEKYISNEKQNVSLENDIINMLRHLNFIQDYIAPKSIYTTHIKRARNRIIKKRKAYRILNNIGKTIFSKPIYRKKDLRIYSSLTESWLPGFLREYLSPEDWDYYRLVPFNQEN